MRVLRRPHRDRWSFLDASWTVRERLERGAGVDEDAGAASHLRLKKFSTTTEVDPLGPITCKSRLPSGSAFWVKVTVDGYVMACFPILDRHIEEVVKFRVDEVLASRDRSNEAMLWEREVREREKRDVGNLAMPTRVCLSLAAVEVGRLLLTTHSSQPCQ